MTFRILPAGFLFITIIAAHLSMQAQDKNVILGMSVGMGIGNLRYIVENEKIYQFGKTYTKCAGISFDIPVHVLEDKVSVLNELSYMQFQAKTFKQYSDSLSSDPVNNYYTENLTFAPGMLLISNIVRYYITQSDFRYYLSFGIYNSFVISSTNKREILHMMDGKVTSAYDDAVPKPATHGLMLLAGTGFSYRNVGFEIRFDPGRNYSNKLNYSIYMPTFTGVLTVQFNPR